MVWEKVTLVFCYLGDQQLDPALENCYWQSYAKGQPPVPLVLCLYLFLLQPNYLELVVHLLDPMSCLCQQICLYQQEEELRYAEIQTPVPLISAYLYLWVQEIWLLHLGQTVPP